MGAMLWGHVFPGGHCRMPWTHPYDGQRKITSVT